MKLKTFVLLLLLIPVHSYTQLNINNLAEYQYGNIPNDDGDDFSNFYARTLMNYSLDNFKLGLTFEQFYSPFDHRNYTELNQFRIQYRTKGFSIKVGNFYETIGRGLLLRSFEIPGAILEDLSYRSRHYFHRDILGVSTKYRYKNFAIKFLYGKPLNYLFPPTQGSDNRRPDEIWAVSTEYGFLNQILELSIMNLNNDINGSIYFNSINLSGNINDEFSYHTELAQSIEKDMFFNLTDEGVYAYYFNLNYNKGRFGLSAEYKNYRNFVLGSGINEPPALVREHSYRLLNRSTHVLVATDEKGFQFEGFYRFKDESVLTFNLTRAVNKLAKKLVFEEYFLEYAFHYKQKHDIKFFADYAEYPFKLEKQRITTGIYSQWKLLGRNAFSVEYEFQTLKRSDTRLSNHYLNLAISIKSKLSISMLTEWSDDPFLTDDEKIWIGGYLNYKFNNKHKIQLFAGQRRGGPACNSGICYDILDFEGIEIRLSSRI